MDGRIGDLWQNQRLTALQTHQCVRADHELAHIHSRALYCKAGFTIGFDWHQSTGSSTVKQVSGHITGNLGAK
jgi:hypothetical protein